MSKSVQSRAAVRAARSPKLFLREVSVELKKVKWPTGQEIWQLTAVVLVTVIAVGCYVAVLDFAFGKLFGALGMYG